MRRVLLRSLLLCDTTLHSPSSLLAGHSHTVRAYSIADVVVHEMREQGLPRLPDVRNMPTGMLPFTDPTNTVETASLTTDKADTSNAASSSSVKAEEGELPPWPIDEIEYNARAVNGGHDLRRQMMQSEEKHDASCTSVTSPSETTAHTAEQTDNSEQTVPRIVALSAVRRAALATLAASDEGGRRQAVQCGGWVCGSCLAAMPYPSRSICTACRTLRHDLASAPLAKAERTRRTNWICSSCGEANDATSTTCQTCQSVQSACQAGPPVQHEGVPAQVRHAALGTVVNLRNRITRWRCAGCGETNSLQGSLCRRCTGERFALTLSCAVCGGANELSNALAYGEAEEDRIHVERPFGLHNCFARLTPSLTCAHCHHFLHGARVQLPGRTVWWCACGACNQAPRMSCMRCRLPRAGLAPALLRTLLLPSYSNTSTSPVPPRWDARDCTTWFCESCDGVNRAARYVVVLRSNNNKKKSASEVNEATVPTKVARMLYGDDVCRHCGQPWHHVRLQQGLYWRCACHKVNQASDTTCQSCGLPGLDTLRSPILSQWVSGDWLCGQCGKQNYRDRVRCVCGAVRPNITRHGASSDKAAGVTTKV